VPQLGGFNACALLHRPVWRTELEVVTRSCDGDPRKALLSNRIVGRSFSRLRSESSFPARVVSAPGCCVSLSQLAFALQNTAVPLSRILAVNAKCRGGGFGP
jgi:hypothetical protein